uniref:Ovule protein n=1 Tax=Brugia timori TaxID=42155 RepID=A0A0R3QA94_9BILA
LQCGSHAVFRHIIFSYFQSSFPLSYIRFKSYSLRFLNMLF